MILSGAALARSAGAEETAMEYIFGVRICAREGTNHCGKAWRGYASHRKMVTRIVHHDPGDLQNLLFRRLTSTSKYPKRIAFSFV